MNTNAIASMNHNFIEVYIKQHNENLFVPKQFTGNVVDTLQNQAIYGHIYKLLNLVRVCPN